MPIPLPIWLKIEAHLGIREGEPEPIVHELAHAYDCIQEKAFEHVGTQSHVHSLLEGKYLFGKKVLERAANGSIRAWAPLSYYWSEIRASAITYLVLQTLGESGRAVTRDAIIHNMKGNLPGSWVEKSEAKFDLVINGKSCRKEAKAISDFLIALAKECEVDTTASGLNV